MIQEYQTGFQDRLLEEKVSVLYLNAPVTNVSIFIISTCFYFFMQHKLDADYLLLWLFFILLSAGIRLLLWWLQRNSPERWSQQQWLTLYTLATGLVGLVWASLYILGYGKFDLVVLLALLLILFGILSAAVTVLSCHLPIFFAYTYPQMFVFAGVLFMSHEEVSSWLLLIVFIYLAMLTLIARNINQQFVHAIRLQVENRHLIQTLNQEVAQREHLIERRTQQLVETNSSLEQEVHDRRQAEENARYQLTTLNSVLNATPDLIYYKNYMDQDGRYIGCNDAFVKFVGRSREDVLRMNDLELFGSEVGNLFRKNDLKTLEKSETSLNKEWVTYPDGHEALMSTLKTPFYNHKKLCIGILGISRDITELQRKEDLLQKNEKILLHLAHHDTLTDLPNRLLMIDRLSQSINRSQRTGKGLAVMFMDLDYFKEINDSLGHSAGDELLKAVATRLSGIIRKEDTAARLGGDEFTIILEELEDARYASSVAEKLLIAFKRPVQLRDREITITMSIGISVYPEHGVDTETLIRNADSAMYKAKKEGRNGFRLYSADLTLRAVERMGLESALRNAVPRNELVLFYQPQVDLATGKVFGVEALIRWQHPEEGLLYPDRFIALAEEIGLIDEIGNWVIEQSCQKIVQWEQAGYGALNIAINISGRQLLDEKFAEKIRRVILETGCNPRFLELEITEGYLIQRPEKTVKQFNELRQIGVQIAIDDFGTGYSSLSYLKQFPFSKLKIDYSFVRDILIDANDQAIARAIIALGKSLGLRVIAEGVEKLEQKEFLLAEGCDEAQGFYYARALPESQLLEYIKQQQK